jgi:hypothetical protein
MDDAAQLDGLVGIQTLVIADTARKSIVAGRDNGVVSPQYHRTDLPIRIAATTGHQIR